MQAAPPSSSSRGSARTRRLAIVAVLLFGLAGLLSGFALGAFMRPTIPGVPTRTGSELPPPVSQQQATTAATAQAHPLPLGFPVVDQLTQVETANNTTTYTVAVHAVDQSIDQGHGKPLHAAGITCKLWLEHLPGSGQVTLPQERLKALNVQQPLTPEELPNGLTFITPQIQQTSPSGQARWTYTVATTVPAGRYYLVVLMDWQGQHYNWSWGAVRIQDAGV